jgi:hypothetical protein
MLAQPAIDHEFPFALRDDMPVCAVERAILQGLSTGERTRSAAIASEKIVGSRWRKSSTASYFVAGDDSRIRERLSRGSAT